MRENGTSSSAHPVSEIEIWICVAARSRDASGGSLVRSQGEIVARLVQADEGAAEEVRARSAISNGGLRKRTQAALEIEDHRSPPALVSRHQFLGGVHYSPVAPVSPVVANRHAIAECHAGDAVDVNNNCFPRPSPVDTPCCSRDGLSVLRVFVAQAFETAVGVCLVKSGGVHRSGRSNR